MVFEPNSQRSPLAQALSLAWELGYTIAVPLVVLALGGRLLDKAWGTTPWLFVTGIILSIVLTTWLIYRKSVDILRASEQSAPKPSTPPISNAPTPKV